MLSRFLQYQAVSGVRVLPVVTSASYAATICDDLARQAVLLLIDEGDSVKQ
jgi:hypothetical protein